MRTLALALISSLTVACASPPSKVCTSGGSTIGGGGGATPEPSAAFALVGHPARLDLQAFAADPCAGPAEGATVDVVVFDPLDQPVTATASAPVSIGGGFDTTVTFTPLVAGPHHVILRFNPNIGTVQRDVEAAADQTGATPNVYTLPPGQTPLRCDQIDFDGDTLLCLGLQNGATALHTIRDGGFVGSVTADTFSFSKPYLWTYSSSDLGFRVFTLGDDGALTALGTAGVPTGGTTQIFAQGDEAMIVTGQGLFDARRVPDAGFHVTSLFSQAASGVQWVGGAGYVLATPDAVVCGYTPDGQQLDAGCSQAFETLGLDDDGVWSATSEAMPALQLSVIGWRAGQPRPSTASFDFVSDVPLASLPGALPASPLLYVDQQSGTTEPTALYLAHFDGSSVRLTRYPYLPPDGLHADSRRLWYQSGTSIFWFAR